VKQLSCNEREITTQNLGIMSHSTNVMTWRCGNYFNTPHHNIGHTWFQTFALFWVLFAFLWVIPGSLNFICRRFGTHCLFHLHRQVGAFLYAPTCLWRWNRQSVPKRRHIKFRRPGNYPKENIQHWSSCLQCSNHE